MQTATVPAVSNAILVLTGAEFLLSMVEHRWSAANGNGTEMESRLKAQQELEESSSNWPSWTLCRAGRRTFADRFRRFTIAFKPCRRRLRHISRAWQKTELARHPQRPLCLDYVERIFTDWSEIHGDRGFADDPAMVCGMARFHGAGSRRHRPPEGARHEAKCLPQLGHAASRRIS